jgi:hypothetical protein
LADPPMLAFSISEKNKIEKFVFVLIPILDRLSASIFVKVRHVMRSRDCFKRSDWWIGFVYEHS